MHPANSLRRWRTTNESATSFASKIPTVTEPVNDGVINLVVSGVLIAKRIMVWPLLLGADNDVASFRFIGWNRALQDSKTTLWVPTVFAEFVCTASACVGIAGAAALETERFADTIVPVAARTRDQKIAAGTSIGSLYEILSPTGDLAAHIILPLTGFEKIELTSDETTNTPSVNALFKFLDD